MKKFMALYMAPPEAIAEMMKSMTPEQSKEEMGKWRVWMDAHKDAIVEEGNPLGKNKRVTAAGISDTRNDICGYTIVQAETHEEAAQLFADNWHLSMPGAYVEILELVPMPEM